MKNDDLVDIISIELVGVNAMLGTNAFKFKVGWIVNPEQSVPAELIPYLGEIAIKIKGMFETTGCMNTLNDLVQRSRSASGNPKPVQILEVIFSTKPEVINNQMGMKMDVSLHKVLEPNEVFQNTKDVYFSEIGKIMGRGLIETNFVHRVKKQPEPEWVEFIEGNDEKFRIGILKESGDETCVVVYNPENPYARFDMGSVPDIEIVTVPRKNVKNA